VYELITGLRVWEQPWRNADPAMLQADTFELVCQINGKVRARVTAPTGAKDDDLELLCREAEPVKAHLDGHEIAKVIVVPNKLVNIVIR
jgi:leucyl-tRNA synthetase